ncbi:MAG: acyl-homoserine-lactone synthase [Lysobacteraceae bacterium]
MASIIIARAGENGLGAPLLDSMYRLRSDVFHRRLGWEVQVDNGREHDWFDLIGPHYLVAHDGASNALGCTRLLPTSGPNMLRDIFPYLLDGVPAPSSPSIWEVSRFAISSACAGDGFGFGDVPATMLAEMFRFAGAHGVQDLVGVTSAPVERMLRHMGLRVERLGLARKIGKVMSLAFRMPVDENLVTVGSTSSLVAARAA